MNTPSRRRSVLVAAAGALALSALSAARLSAGQTDRAPRETQRAPRLFTRMARQLHLDADQRTQFRAILKTHADEIEAQLRASRDARRAIHAAATAEPVDEAAIRSLARKLGDAHAGGALLLARIRAEALPILTTEQQEKLRKLDSRRLRRSEKLLFSLPPWLRGES